MLMVQFKISPGPFYSRCKVGELDGNEWDEHAQKRPGVYFRFSNISQLVFRRGRLSKLLLVESTSIILIMMVTLIVIIIMIKSWQPWQCLIQWREYSNRICSGSQLNYNSSRLERDLYSRKDKEGIEIREWLKADIRLGLQLSTYFSLGRKFLGLAGIVGWTLKLSHLIKHFLIPGRQW